MTNKLFQKLNNREFKKFILLNLILLFITQPGSIGFANFDAPYGFMVDFTTWISSFVGLSPVALFYLFIKRNVIDKKAIPIYLLFILTLAYVTYTLNEPLYEGFKSPDYYLSFPNFLLVCLISAFLSLVMFPTAIIFLNDIYLTYDYDISLGIINLLIFLLIILLSYLLYTENKIQNKDA